MELSLATLRQRRGVKWNAYPSDVLPAWVADMDFEIAPAIKAALDEAIAHSDLGYAQAYSDSGLDEIFCARMQARYGWQINPRQVDFFSDVVQIIYLALLTLTEPGAGVVIQTPIYPPFLQSVKETGRRAVISPLVQGDSGYTIDFEHLAASIDAQTTLLLLCHPHNPTGRAFTRDELNGLAELVLKHDLIVVSDEIHADLALDSRRHIPFASLSAEIAARTVTLTSPSKPFNIAGLCLAAAVFGSDALHKQFLTLPAHVRGGRSALGIAAAHAAWTASDAWLEEVLRLLRANRATVVTFARQWPRIKHTPPQATYLAWLDCRGLGLAVEPYQFFLEHAKVALSEGSAFGDEGRGFVRLNFATSPSILQEILTRMDAALGTL
ncbi:MAG: pyridoxal phosphate-dependent aminotransferase [Gammaproteobacteria bacterium]|nr:pyridoxal phosphate-dependent aminotransferase [Gammaproteobacteria bacterium]